MLLGGRVQVASPGGGKGKRGAAGVACEPPIMVGPDLLPLKLPKWWPKGEGRER